MVNVTDGTNVTMWFGSFKLCFCHFITSSLIAPLGVLIRGPAFIRRTPPFIQARVYYMLFAHVFQA